MPLERQDIERRDFPVTRRGYDPDAVDAHLRRVADEMERIAGAPPTPETLASASAEQVRAIVAAAEQTAAEITRRAQEEADRARREASAPTRDQLTRVSKATRAMLERLEAMERDLDTVQDEVADLRHAGGPARPDAGRTPPVGEEFADEVEVEEVPEPVPGPEPPVPMSDDAADAEGARLIALNMALSGTPRAQADRYLAENFDLDDRERLLDDVYSRVG